MAVTTSHPRTSMVIPHTCAACAAATPAGTDLPGAAGVLPSVRAGPPTLGNTAERSPFAAGTVAGVELRVRPPPWNASSPLDVPQQFPMLMTSPQQISLISVRRSRYTLALRRCPEQFAAATVTLQNDSRCECSCATTEDKRTCAEATSVMEEGAASRSRKPGFVSLESRISDLSTRIPCF